MSSLLLRLAICAAVPAAAAVASPGGASAPASPEEMAAAVRRLVASGAGADPGISRGEVAGRLDYILHDEHGGTGNVVRFVERLEKEQGFPRLEAMDILLEMAADEKQDGMVRQNAIRAFCEIAPPSEFGRLASFHDSDDEGLRLAAQGSVFYALPTLDEKLAFAIQENDRSDRQARSPAIAPLSDWKPSSEDLSRAIDAFLHDRHGTPGKFRAFVERIESEHGVPRTEMEDRLLAAAADENGDAYGRRNAISLFCEITDPESLDHLSPFLDSDDETLRLTAQSAILEALPTMEEKLAFADRLLSGLTKRPEHQRDAVRLRGLFSGTLRSSHLPEEDRKAILSFYRKVATNAGFAIGALSAVDLLDRYDEEWKKDSAERIRILEEWKDDSSLTKFMSDWLQRQFSDLDRKAVEETSEPPKAPCTSERPTLQRTEDENESPALADPSDGSDADDIRESNP